MKKLLITITALVYLTVSSGATVNLHYCMGKLMSWDLSRESKNKCGSCGMEKAGHKGCCKDEQKMLKVDKDQKVTETAFQFLSISSVATTVTHIELPLIYSCILVADIAAAHAPPEMGGMPIFILNHNFRI